MRNTKTGVTSIAFRLLRIEQWSKNVFIFIPAFFAGVFFSPVLIQLLLGFLIFSLLASAVYIFNDLSDVAMDRKHPVKRFRPIAAGLIKEHSAKGIGIALVTGALGLSYFLMSAILPYLLFYGLLNVLYSKFLKKLALFDIIIISSGFLIRVLIGGTIAAVVVSKWLILMTLLLSLLLAFSKRKNDLAVFGDEKYQPANISGYSQDFIKASIQLLSAVMIVCYILYTISPETISRIQDDNIALTSFLVILGVLRYFQQTFVFHKSGSPTKIFLKDRSLQFIILLWFFSFGYFIYLSPHNSILVLWQ